MSTETIYLDRDNEFIRILKEDGVAVDLSSVTRVTIEINGTVYDSADTGGVGEGEEFDCSTGSGKIVFRLGTYLGALETPPTAGSYYAEIVTYDPTNDDGIAWPRFALKVED